MPELPEVETIRRQLKKAIVGKEIADVKIRLTKMVNLPAVKFRKAVKGAKVKDIRRRAKILIIELNNNWSILIHLKLTGQLIMNAGTRRGAFLPNKHSHIIYRFTDGTKLYHNDMRKFGWQRLIKTDQLAGYWQKEKLGPEPLKSDFSLKQFETILKKRPNSLIKPLLMDQKFIAGIGNIYSDEALFYAGVRPTRKVKSLTKKEVTELYQAIKDVLKKAITKHGSSVEYYIDAYGQKGSFVPYLMVYQRQGKPCKKCGNKIVRIKLGGRSAHYCSSCQK